MIGKLRGRSAAELRDRLTQAAQAMAERRGLLPRVSVPAGIATTPVTPWARVDANAVRARLSADETAALIARADRIVAGTFDVLGRVGLSYGTPVDWQRDPLSGRSASLDHWSRIPYLDHEQVGDHKVTWEVNRHQWLIMLGQAWTLTGDSRYVTTASRLLTEWLDANPPKRGINWCSALELAFRVQSWIHGLRLFDAAAELGAPLRERLVTSAAVQIDHVERNISTWFSPNTHLTGEALAMLATGCAWPALPMAAHWRERGWAILCKELTRQFRPDGVYFEQSAWYQSYSVDFYVLGVAWARQSGLAVPSVMLPTIARATRALRTVTHPDGTIARLGDDDGGRTLPLTTAPFGDMTDSLWRAAALLGDPELAPPSGLGRSALLWLEGAEAFDRSGGWQAGPEARRSAAFRDGGWVSLTDPAATGERDHWLTVDVGPHGALSHAHAHADALTFDLSVHGVPVLVDPGTGAYVGAARRRYRSTAVHNTVTVDGTDSSEQGTSFNWRTATDTHLQGFGSARGASWVAAYHDGYHRLADPVRHLRTILRLDRHYWLMFDTLETAGSHQMSMSFQFSPAVTPVLATAHALRATGGPAFRMALDPRLDCTIEHRVVSPAYAAECAAQALVGTSALRGTTTFCTVFGAEDECGPLALQATDAPAVWRVTHTDGADLVACPGGTPVSVGPVTFDGTALVVANADAPTRVVAVGAGTLHLEGASIPVGVEGTVVARRSANGTWAMES